MEAFLFQVVLQQREQVGVVFDQYDLLHPAMTVT
jgi:ABC-type arginine transport system ATPase subunit